MKDLGSSQHLPYGSASLLEPHQPIAANATCGSASGSGSQVHEVELSPKESHNFLRFAPGSLDLFSNQLDRSNFTSMAKDEDSESSSSLNPEDNVDLAADRQWEDLEPDEEKITIISLFDKAEFPDVQSMLQHCKVNHNFDLVKTKAELGGYVNRLRSWLALS